MRPISGFERPLIQWLFVALSVILIVMAGGAAWVARQANVEAGSLRALDEGERSERERLDAQLARERSSREALALELERVRTGAAIEPARVIPTLTLTPLKTRGPRPPAPAVTAQHGTQIIELRLILPTNADMKGRTFEVALREWSSGALGWSRAGLTPSKIDGQAAVTTLILGDALRPGSYELLLSAVVDGSRKEEVAAYEVGVK